MDKPRTLSGTILGLMGAAALLGLWAFQRHAPADKFSAQAVPPPPIAPIAQKNDAETPNGAIKKKVETPPLKIKVPEDSQWLLAQIAAAMATPDAAAWDRVLNELFPALLATDRAAAVRLAENLPAGDQRTLLLRRLARDWGAADFAGAIDWISNLREFPEQKATIEEACLAAAERTPDEAIYAWATFNFSEDDHVLENLVQNWARRDLAAAQAWVQARPASVQRDQAIARVAYVLAQTKPVDAVALIIRELPEGPVQTEAAISILHQWAKNDPAAATTWVAQFPPGPLAQRAMEEIAGLQLLPEAAKTSPAGRTN